jgi:hypothetical protein
MRRIFNVAKNFLLAGKSRIKIAADSLKYRQLKVATASVQIFEFLHVLQDYTQEMHIGNFQKRITRVAATRFSNPTE